MISIKKISFVLAVATVTLFALSNNYSYAQEEATESSDTIREKVKEKLNAALNKPKAYLGSITDITDSTIQINNLDGEIQQITIDSKESTFINVNDDNTEIEYSDVAIGDQIVAIGFVDENNILDGIRILVTSLDYENQRNINNASVVSVDDNKILLNDYKTGEVELTFPRSWKGPEIEEFEEGQNVAAVSIVDDGILTIRTIEILSNNGTETQEEE